MSDMLGAACIHGEDATLCQTCWMHDPGPSADPVKWYLIDGVNPEPWTAPSVAAGVRGGKPVASVYKGEQSRIYQAAIKEFFETEHTSITKHGGELEVQFYFWRQVVGIARYADATNLQKSTEDALQGIVFENDRSNLIVTSMVMAQGPEVDPAILVSVQPARLPRYPLDKINEMRDAVAMARTAGDTTIRPPDTDDDLF